MGIDVVELGRFDKGASDGGGLADIRSRTQIAKVTGHYTYAAKAFPVTPKACGGILCRAVGRGKTLPLPLQRALQAVAGLAPALISTAG